MRDLLKSGKLALWSSALSWGSLGVIYSVDPRIMFQMYGIPLDTPNAYNMIRGVYGGCFLGISALWLLGALRANYRRAALLTMFVCMAGFTFGRTLSVILDGAPTWHMFMWIFFEASGVLLSGYALSQNPPTHTELT